EESGTQLAMDLKRSVHDQSSEIVEFLVRFGVFGALGVLAVHVQLSTARTLGCASSIWHSSVRLVVTRRSGAASSAGTLPRWPPSAYPLVRHPRMSNAQSEIVAEEQLGEHARPLRRREVVDAR